MNSWIRIKTWNKPPPRYKDTSGRSKQGRSRLRRKETPGIRKRRKRIKRIKWTNQRKRWRRRRNLRKIRKRRNRNLQKSRPKRNRKRGNKKNKNKKGIIEKTKRIKKSGKNSWTRTKTWSKLPPRYKDTLGRNRRGKRKQNHKRKEPLRKERRAKVRKMELKVRKKNSRPWRVNTRKTENPKSDQNSIWEIL